MKQHLFTGFLALTLALLIGTAGAATTLPADTTSTSPSLSAIGFGNPGSVIFTGFNVRDDSWYTHLGYLQDLDGDLGTPGFTFRLFGGAGQYTYARGGPNNADITGTLLDADGGFGYRHFAGDWIIGFYSGLHVRDRDIDRWDPSNTDYESTDWGARFVLDAIGSTGPIHWNGIAQFSTVNDAWWTRARAGVDVGNFRVGPEFVWLTDIQFEEYRYGGFISTQLNDSTSLTLSLGYADYTSDQGRSGGTEDDSLYGSLGLSFSF